MQYAASILLIQTNFIVIGIGKSDNQKTMDFRRLHTFRTVAALGSFSKAASILHCSQSTASTQIRILEEELETPLFQRLGTTITLTKAGEVYLRYANKLLSIHDEAKARVQKIPSPPATLSLRMPQSLSEQYLPRIIERFQGTFPHVGFDVSVCAFSELQAELRTGVTDVAFLLAESITREDLRVRCLAEVALCFVCSPDFCPPREAEFELRDLAACTLFVPKHDCSYRQGLKQVLLENDIRPLSVVECNSMAMLKQCVAKGLGVALLPEFSLQREFFRKELVRLSHPSLRMETGLLMILHKNKWVSEELNLLLRICGEEMKAVPASLTNLAE